MRPRYLIGGILILLAAVTTAFTLARTAVPNISFAEARATERTVQIYGGLDKASVQLAPSLREARFRLREEQTGEVMEVFYNHPTRTLNSNLPQASDVRAVGVYNPATERFEAEQLFTKCPSKYESDGYTEPDPGNPFTSVSAEADGG